MDRFEAMRTFVRVVELGSFARAAHALDLSNAAVTRHVAALEHRLGVRLLQRTTRRLSLTETGADYHQHCVRLLAGLEEAEAAASARTTTPRGRLRVSAPVVFGIGHVAPLLPAFLERYPEVTLDLSLSDRLVDLVEEGFDVALRIARLPSSTLVARKLSSTRVLVCAAPSYLARHGAPRRPEDLAAHRCLDYTLSASGNDWRFEGRGRPRTVHVSGPLQANHGEAIRLAALAGAGIALLPAFIVAEDVRRGRLKALLGSYRVPDFGIYAVYPTRAWLPAKVRVFVEHLARAFGAHPPWERIAGAA